MPQFDFVIDEFSLWLHRNCYRICHRPSKEHYSFDKLSVVLVLVVGLVEIVIEVLFRGVVSVVSIRGRCIECPKYLRPNIELPKSPLQWSL
jgi:hypothetical protein